MGNRACNWEPRGHPCPICNHADENNPPAMPDGVAQEFPEDEEN